MVARINTGAKPAGAVFIMSTKLPTEKPVSLAALTSTTYERETI